MNTENAPRPLRVRLAKRSISGFAKAINGVEAESISTRIGSCKGKSLNNRKPVALGIEWNGKDWPRTCSKKSK